MRALSLIAGAAFASVALTSFASAADMPVKARPPVIAGCHWCGFYGGVHVGYGWGDVDASIGPIAISPTPSPSGFFGGAQLGYNWMINPNWLVGVEADISIGSITDTVTLFSAGIFSLDAKSEMEYFGTARARVGYVQGDKLFYATGGLAWARNQVSSNINLGGFLSFPIVNQHEYHIGWTAGVGMEWMFRPRWTVKAEYLYADLGAQDYRTIFSPALVPPVRHEQTLHTVKVGVNYMFDAGSSAHAAYAADMPVKAAVAASCRWCGLYAGVHAGYGWSDVNASIFGFNITPTPQPEGAYGGLQIGYNWMLNPNWLIGLEADVSIGKIYDRVTIFALGPVSLDGLSEMEYFGTIRGRVGYVHNDWLFYGTAGLAWARNQVSAYLVIPGIVEVPLVNDHQYHVGWTVGAGAEWMFANNWSVKAEYLYADLGTEPYTTIITPLAIQHEQNLHTVRLGVNRKF